MFEPLHGAARPRLSCASGVLVALALALLAHTGAAQVALEQYQPAPLVSDGFMLGRPALLAPRTWTLVAGLDYANDPLVYRLDRGPRLRQVVVSDHLVVQLGGALAVHRRVLLFANLPIHALMRGSSDLLVPNTSPDGAALGDLGLGARVALLGLDPSTFALAAELITRLPSAELTRRHQRYAGDELGSYEGALLAELRHGWFAARVRVGARFRKAVELQNLQLGQALTFGLGLSARASRQVTLHAELFGCTYLTSALGRQHTPLELLLGPKFQRGSWWFGAAAGPGLVPGFGSPDFRALATAGFAAVVSRRPAQSASPAPASVVVDADHDGVRDGLDRCPLELEDRRGVDHADGCPEPEPEPDRDGDAIADARDLCPNEPGVPEERGCARSEAAREPEHPVEFGHVEFALGSDVPARTSYPTLQAVQSILSLNTHLLRTRIEGHANDSADPSKNQELSLRRARASARWLVAHGVSATRLELAACGARYPIADDSTTLARQKDRRVEFHVVEPAPAQPVAHADCVLSELR